MIACFWFQNLPIRVELSRLPGLRGEPFVVASSDGGIQAVSDHAAKFGVKLGQSATSARSLCQGLIVLPYDQAAYTQAAEPLWDVLALESSSVEPLSAEVAFLRLDEPEALRQISALSSAISESAAMTVRIGAGSSKLVALRAAQTLSDQPLVVAEGREARFLTDAKIRDTTTVDPTLSAELSKLGVETFGDLQRIPYDELERKFKRIAYKLNRLASGEDDSPVRSDWPRPTIDSTFTFDDPTSLTEPIYAALAGCAKDIAYELQESNRYCRSLILIVELEVGDYLREEESLAFPTRLESDILKAAKRLLNRLHLSKALTEVHVVARDIDAGAGVQLALLDDNDSARNLPHERKASVEATIRYLRRRYSFASVMSAALLSRARRLGFYTHYFAKNRDEEVSVATNAKGDPTSYSREKRGEYYTYDVEAVIDRWKEASWKWGEITEADAFRIVTNPDGTYELCRLGSEWRLRAIAD